MEFLRHILSANGMTMMDLKVEKVKAVQALRIESEMATFLGICGYY